MIIQVPVSISGGYLTVIMPMVHGDKKGYMSVKVAREALKEFPDIVLEMLDEGVTNAIRQQTKIDTPEAVWVGTCTENQFCDCSGEPWECAPENRYRASRVVNGDA